jgi:hypothetical protein
MRLVLGSIDGRPKLESIFLEQIQDRTGRMTEHALYHTWRGLLERCHSSNAKTYSRYGAKSIFVFNEWRNKSRHPKTKRWALGFCLFLDYVAAELGKRPEGHSLDRINNNRGYEPQNLRWANASLQKKIKPLKTHQALNMSIKQIQILGCLNTNWAKNVCM